MRDLISGEAELDEEENEDESFDEETGEERPGKTRANGDMDDSSEEEEDDDDEEAARAVCLAQTAYWSLMLTILRSAKGLS
jgi:transcription elongation factor SPT6